MSGLSVITIVGQDFITTVVVDEGDNDLVRLLGSESVAEIPSA